MLKKVLPFFAILGMAFFGCKNEPVAVAKAAPIPENLGGYWVNGLWWQELQSTKSPMEAAEKLAGPAAAIFHQDSTKWLADLSYNWHEGQQLSLRTKEGKLQIYDPKNAAIQQYFLLPQADGSMLFDSIPMLRLGDAFSGFHAIASALVGGQYDLGGKTVVFNPNGTIVGLGDYAQYEMLLDYVTEDVRADQIQLSKEGQAPDFFAFKIDGDKLQLYEVKDLGGKGEFHYEVGSLKYELTKKS